MKSNLGSIACFLVLTILIGSGCKKLPNDTSLLVLNIHPYFGADSLVIGKNYRTSSGDSLSFSRTSFYLSNVQLTNAAGTIVAVPGYTLVTSATGLNIIAGSIPIGTYKSISFSVGLPSNANHTDPSTYASGPLAVQNPAMHFATDAGGYLFMAVEGAVDSTNTNLSPNKTFSYHIGTDSLFKTANLPDHSVAPYTAFNATGTKVVTIDIVADYSVFLQNVNIPHSPVTNTTDLPVLADTLAAHIPQMFHYLN